MGAVYLAEHPDIGRRVAVKVLRAEMIKDPQLLLRFLNEARAANAIRHPNIIEILDSGTTPEGTPYLVMELLEGEVLSGRIRRLGKLPLADTLEFSYQAASALAAAHEKAIIHRDLKPDNLFIISDPSDPARERIKVLDFGIAKLQTFPTGGGMQTRTGTLMGTPVYMSPEQCLGTKSVDQRSDIYAMGIIMFEMLSGRPPFLSEGFGELVNMHLNVSPPRLVEIDPSIPVSVGALVAKALEKSPEARQRSASELQQEIRVAAGRSIVIRGASSPDLVSATMSGAGAGSRAATVMAPPTSPSVTTMTTGTGERIVTTMPVVKRPARGRLILVGMLVTAVAGVAVFAVSRRDDTGAVASGSPVDVPPPLSPEKTVRVEDVPTPGGVVPKATAPIRLTIDSQPSAATVTDVASGRALGTTPVVVERPANEGSVTIRIEKAGFVPVTRPFAMDRDRGETISLAPVSVPFEKPRAKADKPRKGPRSRPSAARDEEPAKL